MTETVNAPKDESSPAPEEATEAPAADAPETLESLAPETEKKIETVPLSKFMGTKKERDEATSRADALEGELATLKTQMLGMTPKIMNDEVVKLAEKHGTTPEFVAELMALATTATADRIKEELQKEVDPKISKIEQDRAVEARDVKFTNLLAKTLKDMPEYAGVINEDVIKALAFNPANAKKNLGQILEEAYGNAIQGRKTVESAHGGGNHSSGEVDLLSPSEEDMQKINADPALKAKWQEQTQAALMTHI